MIFLIYFFIFIFGLTVGSFLNCIIYRLETGGSFLSGRSFCPFCKHLLGWRDLIPVFSFLILKGKCRYCHQKISWQYPLVELATGFLFVFTLLDIGLLDIGSANLTELTTFPPSQLNNIAIAILSSFYYWVIVSFLIIIFVYDLKHYIIPDKVIYPAIGIAFFYQLFGNWKLEIGNWPLLFNPLISAILAGVFFLAIVLLSRGRWMGVGDIKLAFLMGLILGWPNILVALFLAFFLGAIIGIGLIIAGKKTLKSEVPFAPFLVTGTFIALFWSQMIINWYFNLIWQ